MNLSELAAARRKTKDLRNELKQLKKELLAAGGQKAEVTAEVKELESAMELGDTLQTDYVAAGQHLEKACRTIPLLLENMEAYSDERIRERLNYLLEDLDQVYHECSIRRDDPDFSSTVQCLKRMATDAGSKNAADARGMSSVMLRSELENVAAVLKDAAGWSAPDFLALAYYFLHEDREGVKEMENGQRNALVREYFEMRFLKKFQAECESAGQGEKLKELIQTYVYE